MTGKVPNIEVPSLHQIEEAGPVWGRRRVIFLAASALFVVATVWATREVVLPFVLASAPAAAVPERPGTGPFGGLTGARRRR